MTPREDSDDRNIFAGKIYNLILNQNKISFQEKDYFRPHGNSTYKSIYLFFKWKDILISIRKSTRIKQSLRHEGTIGEERFLFCRPMNYRMQHLQQLLSSLQEFISDNHDPLPTTVPMDDAAPVKTPEQNISEESKQPNAPQSLPDGCSPAPEFKHCRKCDKDVHVSLFHKGPTKDGLSSYCKFCSNQASTESRNRALARLNNKAPITPTVGDIKSFEPIPSIQATQAIKPDKSESLKDEQKREEMKRANVLNFLNRQHE